jgi:hypothetical protein
MLAALGFATIAVFLFAIMSKRLSVLVALILIPTIAGMLAGAGPNLGKMMLDGFVRVAPVGVMIIFAVLYFGLMLDVGLFDPMIRRLLRFVKGDPIRVALATAILTMAVALDGDGATTFLITVSAMLPLYQRLGMSRLVLSGIVPRCRGNEHHPVGRADRARDGHPQGGRLGAVQSSFAGHDGRHRVGVAGSLRFRPSGACPDRRPLTRSTACCASAGSTLGRRARRCRYDLVSGG